MSAAYFANHDKENLTRGAGGPQDKAILYSAELLSAATELKVLAAEQLVRNTSTHPEGPQDTGTTAIDTLLHAVSAYPRPLQRPNDVGAYSRSMVFRRMRTDRSNGLPMDKVGVTINPKQDL